MQQDAEELAQAMRQGCLGVRIGRLHRLVSRRFDLALRPLGLTLPQLEILAALQIGGRLKPGAIADALAVERSTISRNLSRMEGQGWIRVESAPSGYSKAAELTDAGAEVLAGAGDAWNRTQEAVLELLGSDSPAVLDGWLAQLSKAGDG
ncbi:MarR family winged helix-turn-helix transcriptional regulator [Glycomyces xiaoerkulensis]|uniref:MarR family winged helix-turn-helix transcriptional regulator n=1 Tax=Glycomyces xiaoerkulensis TaxID=2038139 RepID=UPI000C258677|nr:MarR family transcriptional regulator [Glycomyces xiaoerkulensis]